MGSRGGGGVAKGGKATGSEHPPTAQQEKVSDVTKHKTGPEREWRLKKKKKNEEKKKRRQSETK